MAKDKIWLQIGGIAGFIGGAVHLLNPLDAVGDFTLYGPIQVRHVVGAATVAGLGTYAYMNR